jgi:malic enzyme
MNQNEKKKKTLKETMFIKTKILSVSCVFLCLKSKYLSFIYYPTSAKDLKKISAKFRQWQDINQERATGLTPTRAMAPLICELWQD